MSNIERSQMGEPVDSVNSALFPTEAPVAPPVPEELEEPGTDKLRAVEATPVPLPVRPAEPAEILSEFIWLFEYGPGMDDMLLNSPERLGGAALLYGPAVLKGYQLAFQVSQSSTRQVQITMLPANEPGAEVWGILYRVPRRCAERRDDEPSLLDKLHDASPPETFFEPMHLIVREQHRGREIACLTYIASAVAQQQFQPFSLKQSGIDAAYVQRFLETARRQKLPDPYVQSLVSSLSHPDEQAYVPVATPAEEQDLDEDTGPQTDQFPSVKAPIAVSPTFLGSISTSSQAEKTRWMMAFAIYLVVLFPLVLSLAVVQGLGFGGRIFTTTFTPLGVPWFVLVYGLLGGCVSCIISLGQRYTLQLPGFVLITWFMRPLIGAVLAALVFQALNSGIFALGSTASVQHNALFSLVGVLAGLCEGWVFYRRIL